MSTFRTKIVILKMLKYIFNMKTLKVKRYIKVSVVSLFFSLTAYAQVGIGVSSPDASAMFEVKSTNLGVLVPRMSEAQRDAISSPATGLLIFQNNNTIGFYYYSGSGWIQLSDLNSLSDATSSSKGVVQLTGVLSGTASSPDLASGSVTNDHLAGSIDLSSKVTNTLSVANGGTGTVSLTGIVKGNGTSAFSAATLGADYSLVREANEEYSATAGQTTFTFNHTPSSASNIQMYINGVRISNNAYSNSGTILTYDPSQNGSYSLVNGDRIQFDYYY